MTTSIISRRQELVSGDSRFSLSWTRPRCTEFSGDISAIFVRIKKIIIIISSLNSTSLSTSDTIGWTKWISGTRKLFRVWVPGLGLLMSSSSSSFICSKHNYSWQWLSGGLSPRKAPLRSVRFRSVVPVCSKTFPAGCEQGTTGKPPFLCLGSAHVKNFRNVWYVELLIYLPSFELLLEDADQQLFNSINSNVQHVLHRLPPPPSVASQHYELRRRAHSRELPAVLADSLTLTLLIEFYLRTSTDVYKLNN